MPITAQPVRSQGDRGPEQDQHAKREELTAKIRQLRQENKIPSTTAAIPLRSLTDGLWRLQLVRGSNSGGVVLLEMHERLLLRGRPRKPFIGRSDGSSGTVWSTMSNNHVELQEAGYGHLSRAWLAAVCEVMAASAEHDQLVRPVSVPAALLSLATRQRSLILLPSPAGGPNSVMVPQLGAKKGMLAAQILLGMAELDWSQVPVLMHSGPGPGEGRIVDLEPDQEPVAVLESTADWARTMVQLARAGERDTPSEPSEPSADCAGCDGQELELLLERARAAGRLEGAAQAWEQVALRLGPWVAQD